MRICVARAAARAASVAFAVAVVLAAQCAVADLTLAPRPRVDPPMRIVRVRSSDPTCQPNCPEWISAEGTVTPGEAQVFAEVVAGLGGRRLPILISSHGGSVPDAIAMGALIRAKGLAVAVARTLIANCPERARECPDARGRAIAGGAACASACPLILAGGVQRFVGPVPRIGVHQITTVRKETEGVEHLTRVTKIYEQDSADRAVQAYLTAMGVGDPVMTLLRKTPAANVRWLSPSEIIASHLATQSLDFSQPMLGDGANGLNGRAVDGDPPRPDIIAARASLPLAAGAAGPVATLEAAFIYRRGGGDVEVTLAAHGASPPIGWTLAPAAGGDSLPLRMSGNGKASALLPRERFCAFVRDDRLVASPAVGAPVEAQPLRPAAFDLLAMDGAKELVAEACP
jgi:hypothetical protein